MKIKNFKDIAEVLQLLFKGSIGIGIILFFIYLKKIQMLPKGLDIGDGLFFILISISFGLLYILLYLANITLMMFLHNILRPIRLVLWRLKYKPIKNVTGLLKYRISLNKWRPKEKAKRNYKQRLLLIFKLANRSSVTNVTADFIVLIFYMFIVIILFGFDVIILKAVGIEYLYLISTSIFLYIMYCNYKLKRNKYIYCLVALVIVILPFVYSASLSSNLTEIAFSIIGARNDNLNKAKKCTVLIESEYINNYKGVIGSYYELDKNKYTRIDNVVILLNGIGSDTIIQLNSKLNPKKHVKLSIPSDKMLVVTGDFDAHD